MDYLINGSDYLSKIKDFKLVGRKAEMDLLSSILVRKKCNSVLLVGPSGVGSTALCLGLQEMKTDDNAPFDLVAKRLFWLDVDNMFSSGDNAEITKAFNSAIRRLRNTIDPILIIEDTGDFYEACRNAGTSHFINVINSAVKEGKLQVILEVSDSAIDPIIKWHSDIRENYTMMDVTEPVGEALVEITNAGAAKLQDFHRIKISEEAIQTAIELTVKYRIDNGLGISQPSRAISLLDRALAGYRLDSHRTPSVKNSENQEDMIEQVKQFKDRQARMRNAHNRQRQAENSIVSVEEKIAELIEIQKEKGSEGPANTGFDALISGTTYDTPEITRLRQMLEVAKEEVIKSKKEFDELTEIMNADLMLTRDEVVKEFSRITGIAANKLDEDEKEILRNLETILKSHVFGQDHVLVKSSNAIKVSRVGRRNKNKPQASFLFMGPSGVGKTEVAKRIAEALQGDAKALLRFDMSEYMERHAVSKLIGAPPGYEGFEAGGILTNEMRKNRNRIILFDEIEKAHPDVFNLFLQILDDGRLTDNVGRVADFSESIIIMTTNIGQPHFLNMDLSFDDAEKLAKVDLDEQYRPEFLNRFNGRQNIICFNRLELDSIEKIVKRELVDVANSYKHSNVDVVVSDACIEKFCEENYDARTGARGLPGFIISQLEPQVTDFILDGNSGRLEFIYENKKFRIL